MFVLLAQHRLDQLGSHFRHGPSPEETARLWIGMAVMAGFVAAGLAAAWWVKRRRRRRQYDPAGLFVEVCRAHGLDRASRRLLSKLAQDRGLTHPARLFLEFEHFQQEHWEAFSQDQKTRLEELGEQLFAAPSSAP